MNTSKKMTFCAGLVLATSLLLWNPLQASAGAGGVSGKVLETMDSGGYSYVLVGKGGAKTWVALPQNKITVGSEIACKPGMEMSNFKSTSLNRTFKSIIFSDGLASAGATVAATPAAATPAVAPAPAEPIKVNKADGASSRSIGEIFEMKDALKDKPVTVQAKVVKISRAIMGKNWLHLQDGTGATGTNDLVVTTDSVPDIGAVVTIKGTLSRDRDFGAGYHYDVIIENAEVTGNK